MPVNGYPFIFDGTPSEFYKAAIVFIDNDWTHRQSGGNRTFTTYAPPRSATQHVLNVVQDQTLSFDVEITFDDPTDIYGLTRVKTWLTSPFNFKKLYICAEGLERYYYNCYFVLNEDLIYNGGYRGVTATVVCDSPFAYRNEQELFLYGGDNIFYNVSEDQEPMKPTLSWTTVSDNAYFFIEDIMYNEEETEIVYDRVTAFISNRCQLYYYMADGTVCDWSGNDIENETEKAKIQAMFANTVSSDNEITFDNESGIITNSITGTGRAKIENFNKILLKMPRGKHILKVTYGGIAYLTMSYIERIRLGGSFY